MIDVVQFLSRTR